MRYVALVVGIFVVLSMTQPVSAAVITIDGTFADWASTAGQVDAGGADDQTSPARADITEYRVAATASSVYMVFAWDDTGFNGGGESTAGMSIKGANGTTYRVYATAGGATGTIPSTTLQVFRCSNASCSSQTLVCNNDGSPTCSGALLASSTAWVDPFASRTRPQCDGASCGTRDTAVEMQLPWSLVGGTPGIGQYAFFQFGSYPSGQAQASKDAVPTVGGNGVSCYLAQGQLQCAPTTPTAITLSSFTGAWQTDRIHVAWTTATEQNSMGFHLLRSETGQRSEAEQVTTNLIPARGNDVAGGAYAWDDFSVQPESVYTYWLQEVEFDSSINEYGPIVVRGPDAPPLFQISLPAVHR